MNTKLTLTIDDKIIVSAKKYAEQKGRSLSNIVENYLSMVATDVTKETEILPSVKKLMGVIKLPKNYDYKKELSNAFSKKYKI
jgi:hypothetical protein